jgi:AAA family ATP:ADP antiporter
MDILNIKYFLKTEKENLFKIIILFICFFIVMGVHTLIKEIKDAVFLIIVGKKYIPDIKLFSWILMLPLILIYSWIATRVKRENLLVIYSLIYGIGGLFCAYFLNDNLIGVKNTISSPERIFGWVFYLFFDGHLPFIVSLLWTFFNSISNPKDVKTSYVLMTFSGKLGGMICAGFAWFFASNNFIQINFDESFVYVSIMILSSILTLFIPILIFFLMKYVSTKNLMGYVDIKELEKNKNEKKFNKSNSNINESRVGGGSGFLILIKNPYVLGIFGMTFFWEVINVIFNYMRLGIAIDSAEKASAVTAFLYRDVFFMHFIGLIIVTFGTSSIIKFFGERKAILLIPIITGASILIFFIQKTTLVFIIIYQLIRAINYAFTWPLCESLYIPTSKEIQFKSKSWIDSFGSKISKGIGSIYNKAIQFIPTHITNIFQIYFFIFMISIWIILSYLLGKKWEKTIKNNDIIGNK